MEERTPALVREALRLLPAPPRVRVEDPDGAPRVVIAEVDEEDDVVLSALRSRLGDYGDDLIYRELVLFERRLCSDALDAAWKAAPLVFHDRRLVDAASGIIWLPPHLVRVPHEFSKNITEVLRWHPGPVTFFSLDSSACPGPELLAEWVDLLSEKAVRSLTMLNLSRSEQMEFPLHRLRGDGTLTSLSLGFFNLRATLPVTLLEDATSTFRTVTTLTLSGCSLDGNALGFLIFKCRILSTLKILGSDITEGCSGRGLTVVAPNLRTFELLQCRVTTALTLDMPALHQLKLDVSPTKNSNHSWIRIHLKDVGMLQKLKHLLLDRQSFSFHTNRRVRLNGRMMVSLPYMQSLSLGINMASADQSWALIGLLRRTPVLSYLNIWRTDTPHDDEGQPWTKDNDRDDTLSCKCIVHYLKDLVVTDYKGGKAELEFVKVVLRRGHKLEMVKVTPHATLLLPIWKADSRMLRTSKRASVQCIVIAL